MKQLLSVLSALLLLTQSLIAEKTEYDKTSVYTKEKIEGFTVMINPEVAKHPKELKEAKKELETQFKNIKKVVPAAAFKELIKTRIWLEWETQKHGAAEYHPSAKWLKNHGYNPEKAKNIEISNTRNFISWSKEIQPWMLMHELSHAYHHNMLGYGHEGIRKAYNSAKQKKIYESVKYMNGSKRKAYAMTNYKEYFAELTEAYFGKNDFYPFNAKELAVHDPEGYKLLKKIWKVE